MAPSEHPEHVGTGTPGIVGAPNQEKQPAPLKPPGPPRPEARPAVVLVEPEIPQNTGNIARTCAATGFELHLVGTLGFSISDKHLKRAGLDYWDAVTLVRHDSLDTFLQATAERPCFFASTGGGLGYSGYSYPPGSVFVFGRETAGLPRDLLQRYRGSVMRIPMLPGLRSLNLSNSAAIIVYEAMRQWGFPGCE